LQAKQRLDVDTEHLVAFQSTVDYDIRRVGGIKTTVFGGEGIFFAEMTGPGKVVLQSMTKAMLMPQTTRSSSHSKGGSMLGGMIRGAMR
ncbi:MAG: AIM24 family protein, partial [Candidatus Woesearchaeota archaeon]|nr:AIM24 family protein [Candidatus Woesearchaeota archaeon]